MSVEGSIWNGECWASNGRKVNWSKSPFQVHYRKFNINGCQYGSECSSESQTYWWNEENYLELTSEQQSSYESVTQKYLSYDYCSLKGKEFKECQKENVK
ncbi:unnamed protein product [Prunus armeniaca]|uniref:Xyloglucan endo-transglycosylase C-terminal domain-containing protein n=1 Tax=Prunus armeniaca TaxID=36596 RepID=A0A6J5VT92_PRUAR|nr:unnamed protein product [Prunus armeniaca]